jgi:hypothetical protein
MPPAVVQRVNWQSLSRSANQLYGIDAANPTKLYGSLIAPDPQPVGLYRKTRESDTSSGWFFNRPQVNVWEPNVAFFNKDIRDQHGHPLPGRTTDIPSGMNQVVRPRDRRDYLFPSWTDTRDASHRRNFLAALSRRVDLARQEVRGQLNQNGTTRGIVGVNDCQAWALMLQKSIFAEPRPPQAPQADTVINQGGYLNIPNADVGDRISQNFGLGAQSNSHAVTVVARDLPTLVTLEAHVEQNLRKPAFHFYAGTAGFFRANNRGPNGADQFLAANGVNGQIIRVNNSSNYALDDETVRAMNDMIADPDVDNSLGGIRARLNAWHVET